MKLTRCPDFKKDQMIECFLDPKSWIWVVMGKLPTWLAWSVQTTVADGACSVLHLFPQRWYRYLRS